MAMPGFSAGKIVTEIGCRGLCRSSSTSTAKWTSGLCSSLKNHARGFPVDGSQVAVLREPKQFLDTLISGISSAERRIVIASLYLGTAKPERQLVDALRQSLQRSPDLKVTILLDGCRGLRGMPNSSTMLLHLLQDSDSWSELGYRVDIAFYQTPELQGVWRQIVPQKYNEIISLQHMKVYLFDDDVLLSGANLSEHYFEQRQDRYILVRNLPALADHLTGVVSVIARYSHKLHKDGSLHPASPSLPNPIKSGTASEFKASLADALTPFLAADCASNKPQHIEQARKTVGESSSSADTMIFPVLQLGLYSVRQDEAVTKHILDSLNGWRTRLASGYFNITDHYSDLVLKSTAAFDILLASPQANGFLGAKGPTGWVPSSYVHICHQFFHRIHRLRHDSKVQLWEYERSGWTFHGKGLWFYPPGHDLPAVTLVGSPNFGYRSVERDLELQLVIVSNCQSLAEDLSKEADHLFENASPVTESTFSKDDHRVPLPLRLLTNAVKRFL